MSTVGYATLQVIPSMKGIESRLGSGLAGPMSSAGSKAGKTLGESTKSSFGSAFGGAKGLIAGLGLVEVASKVKDFFTESIAQARDTQKATAVTAARIKSTGDAAHVSAKQVTELGFALSAKTAIDHNVIQSGANMLLTFKNIGNEAGKNNDIFTQSTKVMLDLAASMAGNGQLNPKAAAIQLGKALNDPVKGLTSLTRVGVQFTDQQKAQITAMVASGNMLGAQKVILKELNSEFKGTAAAQATAGEKMTTAWHNLQDEVGTALLPTLDKLETFLTTKAIPKVSAFVKQMQDGKGAGGQFADTLHSVFDAAKGIAGRIGDVIRALDGMPSWAKKILAGGAIAGFAAKKLGITALIKPTLGKAVGGLVSSAKPVPVFVVNKDFGVPGGGGGGGGALGTAEKVGAGAAGASSVLTAASIATIAVAAISAPAGLFLINKYLHGQDKTTALTNMPVSGMQAGSGGGAGLPTDLGKQLVTDPTGPGFNIFPKGFLAEAGATVGKLAEMKSLMLAMGVPIKVVRNELYALGKTKTDPVIGADSKPLQGTAKQARDQLIEIGHMKPKPVIDGNNKPGLNATSQMIKSLAAVGSKHVSATVDANTSQAMIKLHDIRTAIDAVTGNFFATIFTSHVNSGGGRKKATGGYISGPGTGTSDSIPARLSNGEFVVRAAAAARYRRELEAMNAMRFANGGPVGGRGTSGAGGPTVFVVQDADGRLMGSLRAVARQEINDTADFNRTMAGRQ